MRMLGCALLLLATATMAPGGDAKTDGKTMEGSWRAVIAERDGRPADDKEKGVTFKVVVKDGKFSTFFRDTMLSQGTLKLDPGKKPKEIDAALDSGEFKGKVQMGLYELMGDEMRVIFAEPGQDRPTSFNTAKGQTLLHYTRIKETKK